MYFIILNFNWDPKSAQLMRPLWSQVSCVSFHGLCLAQCAMKDLWHIEPPFVISDYEAVLNYQPNHQGRVSDVHQPCLVSSLPSHSPVIRMKFPLIFQHFVLCTLYFHQTEIPTDFSTLCIVIKLKFPVHFPTLCIVHFVFSLEWKIHTDLSTLCIAIRLKIFSTLRLVHVLYDANGAAWCCPIYDVQCVGPDSPKWQMFPVPIYLLSQKMTDV